MSVGQTTILTGPGSRDVFKRIVDQAPYGAVASVKLPTRTLDQNNKMHAMLSDVARSKPGGRKLTADQWKCLFMDAVAKETKNASFTSRWEPSLDGEGVVNTGYRSSRLAKDEMAELISFIDAWGTENGVIWSDDQKEQEG